MTQLTPRASAWYQTGALTEIAGRRIFVRERPGTDDGRSLILLHGYPSSSFDWRHAFKVLPAHHLIAFDFLGYGLSEKSRDQVYSLGMQADIAEVIVDRFAEGPTPGRTRHGQRGPGCRRS